MDHHSHPMPHHYPATPSEKKVSRFFEYICCCWLHCWRRKTKMKTSTTMRFNGVERISVIFVSKRKQIQKLCVYIGRKHCCYSIQFPIGFLFVPHSAQSELCFFFRCRCYCCYRFHVSINSFRLFDCGIVYAPNKRIRLSWIRLESE